jgi:hypothetical protein
MRGGLKAAKGAVCDKVPGTPAAAPAASAVDNAPEFSATLRHLSSSLIATAIVSVLTLNDAASAATSAILWPISRNKSRDI